MANELSDFHRNTVKVIGQLEVLCEDILNRRDNYRRDDAKFVVNYLEGKIAGLNEALSNLQEMRLIGIEPPAEPPRDLDLGQW